MKSLRSFIGAPVRGVDGKLGKGHDFYFDDETWEVAYFVVSRGWLPRHSFLAAPDRIDPSELSEGRIALSLSKKEAKASEGTESVETVTEHERKLLKEFYGTSDVSSQPGRWAPHESEITHEEVEIAEEELHAPEAARRLRSVSELIDYVVEVEEGAAAHVQDFLTGDRDWIVKYVIVNTKHYSTTPRDLLVPVEWIEEIRWEHSAIVLKTSRERLLACQKYEPASHVHVGTGPAQKHSLR